MIAELVLYMCLLRVGSLFVTAELVVISNMIGELVLYLWLQSVFFLCVCGLHNWQFMIVID